MIRNKLNKLFVVILRKGFEKEKGIDGILVTVGLKDSPCQPGAGADCQF